ncbi:MAG: MaoC/PaaZ C-terminal domain-containing protein [Desulfosarcinaceae bacterium]|jgi:acyl dehydratase
MALQIDRLGMVIEKVPFTYDEETVILYALGIGFGSSDAELPFVHEKDLKVFPTFAVAPFMPIFMREFVSQAGIDLKHLLHGEHRMVLHKPIPLHGTLFSDFVWEAVYDKGDTGAVIQVASVTRDGDGETLFENRALFLDRSAGHFGGDRGPKAPRQAPATVGKRLFRKTAATAPQQAALYRLSGDKNPLHIEPGFARHCGFKRPILHGLCTFGIACRAVLATVCGNEPTRLKRFDARFVDVVYPGDTLTTEGWASDTPGTFCLQTTNQNGEKVLDGAHVQVF